MKLRGKRSLSILLSLALLLGMLPGMSLTAYADAMSNTTTEWSGEYTISSDLTITGPVTLAGDTTLTFNDRDLTVNGGINTNGYTLTVTGEGELDVTGTADGGAGITGTLIVNGDNSYDTFNGAGFEVTVTGGDGGTGGAGGIGILGNLTVQGGKVTVTGGDGGSGGNGGNGIEGNVSVVECVEVTVTGGDGGSGGNGGNGLVGSVGGPVTMNYGSAGGVGGVDGAPYVQVAVNNVLFTQNTTLTIKLDGVAALTASIEPFHAADKAVKWSVSSEAVKLYSEEECINEVSTDYEELLTVYAKGIAAGNATVTVTTSNGSYTADRTVTVEKLEPTADAPTGLTATYGQTLGDVTLTNPSTNTEGNWAWVDSSTSVGNAGSNTFQANFIPEDTASYNMVTKDVTVTVSKVNPIAVPPTATANYGQTLAGVTLTNPEGNTPGTWTWVDSSTSVGEVGSHTFKANFTPTDATNYNSVSNVDVTVTVSDAIVPVSVISLTSNTDTEHRTIKVGDTEFTYHYDASINPENATDKTVKWTCTDGVVLYFDDACTQPVGTDATDALTVYAKFVKAGSVTVTVTANADSTKSAYNSDTISKGDPIVTAPTATATYGQTLENVTLTNPEGNMEGTWTWANSTASVGDVGDNTFQATFTPTDTANYNSVENVDVTVTVSPKDMTVSAENVAVTVDGQPHGITVNVTDPTSGYSVKYGTTEGSYTLDDSPTQTEVGTQTVYYQVTADNYNTATGSATITVNAKLTQTITASDITVTYGDTDKSVSATTTGDGALSYAVKSGSEAYIDVNASTGALTIRKAGTATITVTAAETATYAQATKDVTVTIAPASVTLTANSETKPYTGEAQTVTGFTSSVEGLTFADTVTASGSGTDLGDHTVTISGVTLNETTDTTGNYVVTGMSNGTLTITKADSTVTKRPAGKSLTYSGAAQALVNAGEATGGTLQYALGQNATTAPENGWAETIPTGTATATYYVWYKVVGDANHNDTTPTCVTAAISSPSSSSDDSGSSSSSTTTATTNNTSAPAASTTDTTAYTTPDGAALTADREASTETKKNADGSVTVTDTAKESVKTENADGSKVETKTETVKAETTDSKKNADGSVTDTTKVNNTETVTETATNADGNKAVTETKTEQSGSTAVTTKDNADGSKTETTAATETVKVTEKVTDASGKVTETVTETSTESKVDMTIAKDGTAAGTSTTKTTVKDEKGNVLSTAVTEAEITAKTDENGTTVTETAATTTTKDANGKETVEKTVTTGYEAANGSTGSVVKDENGKVLSQETSISEQELAAALDEGRPVQAPLTVEPVPEGQANAATPVQITLPSGKFDQDGDGMVSVAELPRVEIQITVNSPGVIAMLRDVLGRLKPIKECFEGSVIVPVTGSGEIFIVNNSKSFADVPDYEWYNEYVAFVTAREIFKGMEDGSFAPDAPMTRAMLTQVLYSFHRGAEAGDGTRFGDVVADDWFNAAVGWAYENKVVNGYDNGSFGANDSVSRQDMATILYRYAKWAGYDVSASASLDRFPDAGGVEDYALDAMRWAVGAGLISGNFDGTLAPTAGATRAQVAAIMTRFVRNAK